MHRVRRSPALRTCRRLVIPDPGRRHLLLYLEAPALHAVDIVFVSRTLAEAGKNGGDGGNALGLGLQLAGGLGRCQRIAGLSGLFRPLVDLSEVARLRLGVATALKQS